MSIFVVDRKRKKQRECFQKISTRIGIDSISQIKNLINRDKY